MTKLSVNIKSKSEKTALIEGAGELCVKPSEVKVTLVEGDTYTISLRDSPGQIEMEAREDKMAAILRIITPSSGSGRPVTTEDLEKALAKMGVIYGIDKDTIQNVVTEVAETGSPIKNTIIAKGTPPKRGEKGRIEMKTGRDAANTDPKASSVVKPGQVVAVKIPATGGAGGKNIFGEEVPASPGVDIEFSAGDNVTTREDGVNFISEVYGVARGTWKDVSVTNFLRVSGDGMWAEMPLYPTLADNSPLTFEDITAILKNGGIKHGINETLIKTTLDNGDPVENFRVAEATPARDGIDAKIDFRFRLNGDDPETTEAKRHRRDIDPLSVTKEVVSEGDMLAVKIPAVKPVNGRTVTGMIMKGTKPKDKRVTAGDNVTIMDDGLTYVVAKGVTAGYADYINGSLSVESPLYISEDKLSASISIHPPSTKGKTLTREQVNKIIAEAGVVYGVDTSLAVRAIVSAAGRNTPLHDVVVAKGRAPVNGEDAIIDIKFEQGRRAGTCIKGSDRMDFKEQASIHNVKKGDILAVKAPVTTGKEGINVFGDVVPAVPSRDKILFSAGNVNLSDDGLIMTAGIEGMVSIKDENKIGVFKSHEVSGDIDLTTGNLTMDGSLTIKGWIRSGFIVRASGEIHISGGVEDAIVEAGSDLVIYGGILGSNKGKIYSGGNLTVFFIENAGVHVGGDMLLRDSIRNSRASVGGIIKATGGKGCVVGGTVGAFKGIMANEIGSVAGVKTKIIVGIDLELKKRIEEISKRLEDFKRQRAKMDVILSRYARKGKSLNLPKNTRFKLKKLVRLRRKTVLMETRQTEYRKKLLDKVTDTTGYSPTVTVNNTVYAGTTIVIGGCALEVEEDIAGKSTFYLNQQTQGIERKNSL